MSRTLLIARWSAAGLAILLGLALAAALLWRAEAQARNTAAARITAANGIAEAGYVEIGGLAQWVTIRGRDRANPILLVLDGGPGYATSPFAPSPLERDFTVVRWDQPGAGRTFARAGRRVDPRLTEDDFARFGIEVAEHARRRLGQPKVGLLATSWGTLIGLRMVRARPDLFYAYVGAGQVVDGRRAEDLAYRRVLAKAAARNDRDALRKLRRIGPPPFASQDELSVQRLIAMGYEAGAPDSWSIARAVLTAPGYSLADARNWIDGFLTSTRTFYEMRRGRDAPALGFAFDVPIFIFQGDQDDFTPHALAAEYFDRVRAPRKAFVSVAGAGHFAIASHAPQLRRLLLDEVRPLAAAGGTDQ